MDKQASILRAGFASLVVSSVAGTAFAYQAPPTTPAGITIVDVAKLMDVGAAQFLWRRLGDADGRPLYTSDADQPGKSNCSGECAKEFLPYAPVSGTKAGGDWTIISRGDRTKQWAYQGKPLYSYSGTNPRGEPQGGRFQLKEDPAWHDPGSRVFSPKQGWRRAEFSPESTLTIPTSLEVKVLPVANGVGLANAATHMTVYAIPSSHKLSADWRAVPAAALAVPTGDFKILTRKDDGTRQWSYRGDALYTYDGDNAPGEVNGVTTGDRSIQPALVYRDFTPPGVTLDQYPGVGPLMTEKGMTLYTVARFHHSYGGLEALGGYQISYNELKEQGTVGCEGDCTKTWKPLLADSNAHSSGLWEVVTRDDHSKQWAFKGSPVYTYIGDQKPGDTEGNARHIIAYGGRNNEVEYLYAGDDPHSPKLSAGNLTMAKAVGMSPGERPSYVAGPGFVATAEDRKPNSDNTPVADVAVAANAPRSGGAGGAGGAGAFNDGQGPRNPTTSDHGAGFYWHAVQPY